MNRWRRLLVLLLRIQATVMGLAFLAAIMPSSWMAATSQMLGLTHPSVPLTEYLTRSLSALYGVYGSLGWVTSSDVERYSGVITYMGVVALFWGPLLFAIDLFAGMPTFWAIGEVIAPTTGGALVLFLQRRAREAR